MMNFLDRRLPEKFWDRVSPCPMSGCWLWIGSRDPNGYGMASRGKLQRAHQQTFTAAYGAVPAGLEIDHRCRNRTCCNPLHLEAVSHRENMLRSVAVRKYPDTCPHGHLLEQRRAGADKRLCIECRRISRTKYNHKVRGLPQARKAP